MSERNRSGAFEDGRKGGAYALNSRPGNRRDMMKERSKAVKKLIHKAYRGQMGAYLQFFVLLLLAAAILLVAMSMSGCDSCWCDESTESVQTSGSSSVYIPVQGPISVSRGERINLTVRNPLGQKRTIQWYPGSGAYDFQFSKEPSKVLGNVYEFELNGGETLNVSYQPPAALKSVDLFSDGHQLISVLHETYIQGGVVAETEPQLAAAPLHLALPEGVVPMWQVSEWLDPQGVTLTTELCQTWLPHVTDDDFFLAVRMPLSGTNGTYPLPLVYESSPHYQSIHLYDRRVWPNRNLITATLEYRPARFTFLANEMPSAPGEHWIALGISTTEPITCPTGLNIEPDKWGLKGEFLLDLHDLPNAGEGSTLRVYGCYEGQDSPLDRLQTQALVRSLGMESYQGQGITCVGPKPIHLLSSPPVLHLGGDPAAAITPTLPITVHKYLYHNQGGAVITLTMDYTSSVQGWQFYKGDQSGPDLGAPITPNETGIVLAHSYEFHYIWAINDSVPANTPAGPHSLVITTTSTISPALNTWDTTSLWSGGWVAPPPAEGQYRVYLPLVLRNR